MPYCAILVLGALETGDDGLIAHFRCPELKQSGSDSMQLN